MSLRTKVLFGFGLSLSLMAVVLFWGIMGLYSLRGASQAILSENYRSILAVHHMALQLDRQHEAVLRLTGTAVGSPVGAFRKGQVDFLLWLGRAAENITISGEGDLVKELEQDYLQILHAFDTLAATVPAEASGSPAMRDFLGSHRQAAERLGRIHALNETTMFQASQAAKKVADQAIMSTALVGLVGLLVGVAFSLVLSNWINEPLRRLMKAARNVGEGNYEVKIPITTRDELGRLTREFNAMAARLRSFHRLNIGKILAEKRKGEAVLTSLDDGIIVLDPDQQITDLNKAARRLLDLDPEFTIPCHLLRILPQDPVGKSASMVLAGEKPAPSEGDESTFTTDNRGEVRHLSASISPILRNDTEVVGAVILVRDVTRRREIDRLKTEFVMAASHELHTPLTSISLSVDLLRERVTTQLAPRDAELLQVAHEELQRLKALVKDLLDLSKLEAGRITMEIEPVPVALLFERIREIFHSQVAARSINLHFPSSLPTIVVEADPNKITWVLTNLVSNALRYVPDNGTIGMSAKEVGEFIHFEVSDDGPGIPREYQSRIFQKFVQVKGDRTPGGTGLGLAICREVVRAHSGTIWVESDPGQGSRFIFAIPAPGAKGGKPHGEHSGDR